MRVIKVSEWGEADGSRGQTPHPYGVPLHAILCESEEEAYAVMDHTRSKTIQECIFALCPYCKASAETGHTTEHRCKAKPLFELMYG